MASYSKKELFESVPVSEALKAMAVPTIISQLINLVYNMVDAFFIGRTGSSYMMAATTVTLTLTLLNVAFSNLFGVGGGSQVARLMGQKKDDEARAAAAFSFCGAILLALSYSLLIGCFMNPVLRFLGASDMTIGFAREYTVFVIVIGSLPAMLSLTLAHLLRNTGYSSQASFGLSFGGVLNMILDPLFMFVLLPRGSEVKGAAIATLLSNICACIYLLRAYYAASERAPLSMSPKDAGHITAANRKAIFTVGIPSAILTGLFDLANICVNILSAAHSDLVLAAMGIVMKVERIPNAVNIGICQGMLPIVAYNYSSGNHRRMKETVDTARTWGIIVSLCSIVLLEIFAPQVTRVFLSVSEGGAEEAKIVLDYAAMFLRIRCLASIFQLLNYHASFCMQAMGNGRGTMLHALVRELVFYIPCMFLLDRLFGEAGLASALVVGEALGACFATFLLRRVMGRNSGANPAG